MKIVTKNWDDGVEIINHFRMLMVQVYFRNTCECFKRTTLISEGMQVIAFPALYLLWKGWLTSLLHFHKTSRWVFPTPHLTERMLDRQADRYADWLRQTVRQTRVKILGCGLESNVRCFLLCWHTIILSGTFHHVPLNTYCTQELGSALTWSQTSQCAHERIRW